MKNSVTCLIPFYNEGERILNTLSVLSQSNCIKEIICIDDGSTDHSVDLVKKKFPHVKVLVLKNNAGKANAIKEGLYEIKTEYTLLFDADLRNIKITEIENAISKIQQNSQIDMIILRRIIESKFLSLIRHDIVMSGQRILRTEDLRNVFQLHPDRYEIEMAINQYMIDNNKKVYWMPLSTKNQLKIIKMGFFKSLRFYFSAIKGFITFRGFKGYLYQVRTFCRDEAI